MVEGKGFVFVCPLTSRYLSTPSLQIAARRGKARNAPSRRKVSDAARFETARRCRRRRWRRRGADAFGVVREGLVVVGPGREPLAAYLAALERVVVPAFGEG